MGSSDAKYQPMMLKLVNGSYADAKNKKKNGDENNGKKHDSG